MADVGTPGPLDAIIDGHVIRVDSNQFVTFPDTATITLTDEVDAYKTAVDAADEAGEPLYQVANALGGNYARVRNLPAAGIDGLWDDGTQATEPWADNITCYLGFIYSFDGDNYTCIQGHNAQSDWSPPVVPALFTKLRIDLAPWVQPIGSTDAYRLGERVTHGGKQWSNDGNDANVWEPGTIAAWVDMNLVTVSAWVQPTGGQDAYAMGAVVTHNGQTWSNTGSDANVWEPGAFGWTVV